MSEIIKREGCYFPLDKEIVKYMLFNVRKLRNTNYRIGQNSNSSKRSKTTLRKLKRRQQKLQFKILCSIDYLTNIT